MEVCIITKWKTDNLLNILIYILIFVSICYSKSVSTHWNLLNPTIAGQLHDANIRMVLLRNLRKLFSVRIFQHSLPFDGIASCKLAMNRHYIIVYSRLVSVTSIKFHWAKGPVLESSSLIFLLFFNCRFSHRLNNNVENVEVFKHLIYKQNHNRNTKSVTCRALGTSERFRKKNLAADFDIYCNVSV